MQSVVPRSLLFVPLTSAHRYLPSLMRRADAAPWPDALILDLEDSIPDHAKEQARRLLAGAMSLAEPFLASSRTVYVRINGVESGDFGRDVDCLRQLAGRDIGVMLSKCDSAAHLDAVFEALPRLRAALAMPLVETVLGFANRDAIFNHCRHRGIGHVAFGAGDMSLELGIPRDYRLDLLRYTVLSLVLSARTHGLSLIDAPSRVIPGSKGERGWQEIVEEECAWSFSNGLSGKLAVHPGQIPLIHQVLDRVVDDGQAEQVVRDFENAPDRRYLTSSSDGRYMGAPSLKQALRTLEVTARRRRN